MLYLIIHAVYHLLVETVDGNLSQGMRHLNGQYTQSVNRRHDMVGRLFQGRYKSILVQNGRVPTRTVPLCCFEPSSRKDGSSLFKNDHLLRRPVAKPLPHYLEYFDEPKQDMVLADQTGAYTMREIDEVLSVHEVTVGDTVEVKVLGRPHKAVILHQPPFDADGKILRS